MLPMDDHVLVSIITVCYNSEKTISQTMESVLRQTYPHIEYIIVDGNSTDNTMKLVEEYQELFEGRMKVVSEPDHGIYDAMNKGIKMAAGELIGIINSDDFYENNAVENMVSRYQKGMCGVLYGATRKLVNEKEESISISSHEFLEKRPIAHPSSFITKSAYESCGLYDTKYSSVADYDLLLRYYRSGRVTFIPVYEVIANFRSGGTSGTHKAYLDLLRMKRNYGMITQRQYLSAKWKAQLSKLLHH